MGDRVTNSYGSIVPGREAVSSMEAAKNSAGIDLARIKSEVDQGTIPNDQKGPPAYTLSPVILAAIQEGIVLSSRVVDACTTREDEKKVEPIDTPDEDTDPKDP